MSMKNSLNMLNEYKQLEDQQLSFALLSTYEKMILLFALAGTKSIEVLRANCQGKQSYGLMDAYMPEIEVMLAEAKARAVRKGLKIPSSTKAKALTCELDKSNRVRDWEARFMQLGPLFADSAGKDKWKHFSAWRDGADYIAGPLHEKSSYATWVGKFRPLYDDDRISLGFDGRLIDRLKRLVPSKKEWAAEIARARQVEVK